MLPWPADEFRTLRLEEIDERYRRYRVTALEAEEAMARSLRRYGQISPLVVCLRKEIPVLVDGFKRLAAARGLKGFETLSAKQIDADERAAKAAFVLEDPRRALREAQAEEFRGWDPRLSAAGNRVSRQLAVLLDRLARMTNWLRHHGRGDLALCDRSVLESAFTRLAGEAHTVAELTDDFVKEIHLPYGSWKGYSKHSVTVGIRLRRSCRCWGRIAVTTFWRPSNGRSVTGRSRPTQSNASWRCKLAQKPAGTKWQKTSRLI